MNSSFLPSRDALAIASEVPSLVQLLKHGLECFRQGCHTEGMTFFALAREQLAPDQIRLAAVLDTLAQSHIDYSLTQEELLQASKRFTMADAEQETQVTALENLLPTLVEKTNDQLCMPSDLKKLPEVSSHRTSFNSYLRTSTERSHQRNNRH